MKKLLATTALIGGLALAGAAANATTISVGLQTTGGIVNEASSTTGNLVFAGSMGSWVINDITASDQTLLPAPGILNSTSLDIKGILTGASTLKVYVTSQGLTGEAALENFLSSFTSNVQEGSVTSVTEQTFVDDANGLFTLTTPLGSHVFPDIGTFTQSNSAALSGTYSATEVYTIVAAAGTGSASSTIDLSATAVPEPASIALMGIGLLGVGFVAKRKRSV
jgi:hypothetical protein